MPLRAAHKTKAPGFAGGYLLRGETSAAARPVAAAEPPPVVPQRAIFDARSEIAAIEVADAMERYMADLVYATRTPQVYSGDLARWIEIGASPRASLALDKCGRAHAWLAGRDYVDPQDVQAVVHDVFRHRLTLSYEAQGEAITPDRIADEIVAQVALT